MNIEEQKLHNGMEHLRLSPAEKDAMRASLMAHMRRHPRRAAASPWQWLVAPRFAAPALVVLLCASTAYAAEGALPGDPLYAVKIHVNETLGGALAVGDPAKAAWNASVANERVVEAQRLAVENRLTASASAQLQSDFETHASAAAKYADTVSKDDPVAGAALEAQLTAVNAQGAVLAQLGDQDKDKQTKENALAFADHVRASASAGADEQGAAPAAAAPMLKTFAALAPEPAGSGAATTSKDDGASAAAAVKTQAANALLALQKKYSSLRSSLATSTAEALDAKNAAIQDELDAGDAASSSDQALSHYKRALSMSVTLTTFLKADAQFRGKNLLSSLLRTDGDDDGNKNNKESGEEGGTHAAAGILTAPASSTGSTTPALGAPSHEDEASTTEEPLPEGSGELP